MASTIRQRPLGLLVLLWASLPAVSAAEQALPEGAVVTGDFASPETEEPEAEAAVSEELSAPDWEEPLEVFRLDNGLEVVLWPEESGARVALAVSYAAGQREQPAELLGLAEVAERLMFDGSRRLERGEHLRRLERVGATDVGSFTLPDSVTFHEVLPARHLGTALWLEAERMASVLVRVDEEAVERRVNEVRQGLELLRARSAITGLDDLLRDELYPAGHPYRHLGADEEGLERIELEHVQWFFQQHYTPARARIVLVGGFDPAAARRWIEQLFGPIRGAGDPRPEGARPELPPLVDEIRVNFGARTSSHYLMVDWLTPPFLAPGDAEMDFLAFLLAHGDLSRLHQRLVEEQELAESVGAWQYSRELGSTFRIQVRARPQATAEELLAAIDEEVERLCREVAPADELSRVRYENGLRELVDSQTPLERATALARIDSPLAEDGVYRPSDNVARYAAVTGEMVRHAACELLPLDRRVITWVIPRPDAPPEGEGLHTGGGARR